MKLKFSIKDVVKRLEILRRGDEKTIPQDISFSQYIQDEYNTTPEEVYRELGIDPNRATINFLLTLPDSDLHWLVPEIIRDAILKGFRETPWTSSDLIALDQTVGGLEVTMPYLNLSEAEPQDLLEAETIGFGSVSYGSKSVKVGKAGIGISFTYESIAYTAINLAVVFLRDLGIKLGHRLNRRVITTLIDGDQVSGSESAAVIGVDNPMIGITYKDLLRAWIRGSLLGRRYISILSGEEQSNDLLNLEEFKKRSSGRLETPTGTEINIRTPLPTSASILPDANIPSGKIILVDPAQALVQLTAQPLMVESDRIIDRQIERSVATITTGFANIQRDARIIIDGSLAWATNQFPAWMAISY